MIGPAPPLARSDAVGGGIRLLVGSLWRHVEVINEALAATASEILSQQASSSAIREQLILIKLRAEAMRAICAASEAELARRAAREPERSIR